MRYDLHVHSIYSSDSRTKVREILKVCKKIGLDGICIADHNSLKGSLEAIKLKKDFEGLIVVPGVELSTKSGHLIALGIYEEINNNLGLKEIEDEIEKQNGLKIAPHPYSLLRKSLLHRIGKINIDAIETHNSKDFFRINNFFSTLYARKNKLPMTGGSDAHFLDEVGRGFTLLEANNEDEVLSMIKKGKCKPYFNPIPPSHSLRRICQRMLSEL
ncbi:MAG: PHP domain-containing protein [Candidatus Hydrothermarchaeota archaeon]